MNFSTKLRLKILKNKTTLNDSEMSEFIYLQPSNFRSAPHMSTLGIINFYKSFSNLQKIIRRITKAKNKGFYMEAISLKMLLLDFLLRIYLVSKTKQVISFEEEVTFGRLVKRAEHAGLDSEMVKKLYLFNRYRIKTVHQLLLGTMTFNEIESEWHYYDKIQNELLNIVFNAMPSI
jgi:hypothetical protein